MLENRSHFPDTAESSTWMSADILVHELAMQGRVTKTLPDFTFSGGGEWRTIGRRSQHQKSPTVKKLRHDYSRLHLGWT